MPDAEVDLLEIECGSVTAPAGCGKTHLIAETLLRHSGPKPILVLTHTNAGVAALRGRLSKLASKYLLFLRRNPLLYNEARPSVGACQWGTASINQSIALPTR